MKRGYSLATALVVATPILCFAAASESDADPHFIRRGTRTTSHTSERLDTDTEIDFRTTNLLEHNHNDFRKLQTTSCTGNKMMCGCDDVHQTDYRGRYSVSRNGFKCLDWTMADDYPNQGLDDGAYCRNPDGVGESAWCFVDSDSVLWDYCEVPMCPMENFDVSNASSGCFNTQRYNEIYADIERIKDSIGNDVDRSHFLGGIVRLVAHDFMDYDMNANIPMGADGCLLFDHEKNVGLSSIWCDSCPLKQMYDVKYGDLSRADFWVAAANAVVYLTSVNNELDLRSTFLWGRETVDACPGSNDRLPTSAGCQEVEGVFLDRMGLTWNDGELEMRDTHYFIIHVLVYIT